MHKGRRKKEDSKDYTQIFGFTFGQISFAAFIIAAVSGVALAIPYNIAQPYESLSFIALTNQAAHFFRGFHNWSAQIFLIFSLFHIYDHLRLSTEKNVSNGVWLRLVFALLFTFFIMLTGFILKGDSESIQARRIFESLFQSIPFIGQSLSFGFLGKDGDFQILYVHHIASATIFLWIVIVEHAKSFWPKLSALLYLLLPLTILTFLFPPQLHDNLSPLVKGPWYFLGLQEIFHWLSYPVIVIVLLLIILLAIYLLPKMGSKKSLLVKKSLLGILLVYSILIIIGYFFRGENWKLVWPWENTYFSNTTFNPIGNVRTAFASNEKISDAPIILGRYESCMVCHNNMKGFSPAHDPKAIGCYSCHLGNPSSIDKETAHNGMILIPGNLDNAKLTCGSPQCHEQIIERVNKSIMTSMNGVVSVDKWVFGESKTPTFQTHITEIGFSPADTHLRNLCASCHLGNEKIEWGPVNQLSRGGGCNACHLNYSKEANVELSSYKEIKGKRNSNNFELKNHPSLSLNITNELCFGCHSRSGRISLSYDGWHETPLTPNEVSNKTGYKILDDGRVVSQIQKDIHSEKGMRCVDCHTSFEVMGDGNYYLHKEDQIKIQCIDCHTVSVPKVIKYIQFESEPKKIADILGLNDTTRRYLTVMKNGEPVVNSSFENGKSYLFKKSTGEKVVMKTPAALCITGNAHKYLSCNSCHNSWTPQCIGCHTEYDKNGSMFDLLANKEAKGEWIEHQKEFFAEPSTLGIREEKDLYGNPKKTVYEFMPGMIITIDKDKISSKDKMIFNRLFAPAFSHTIRKESRSCESCHNSSLALGYGRGELEYKIEGNKGRWKFQPKYLPLKYDGLPEDAWIGFLKEGKKNSVTRENARPFTLEEQKRILTVGACLICHQPGSQIMKASLIDFDKVKSNLTKKCILPAW